MYIRRNCVHGLPKLLVVLQLGLGLGMGNGYTTLFSVDVLHTL